MGLKYSVNHVVRCAITQASLFHFYSRGSDLKSPAALAPQQTGSLSFEAAQGLLSLAVKVLDGVFFQDKAVSFLCYIENLLSVAALID